MPCCSSTTTVALSEERQASSGRFGSQTQNQSRRAGVGVNDNGFVRGSGSENGNTCCGADGGRVLPRALTGDFHARAMVKAGC